MEGDVGYDESGEGIPRWVPVKDQMALLKEYMFGDGGWERRGGYA